MKHLVSPKPLPNVPRYESEEIAPLERFVGFKNVRISLQSSNPVGRLPQEAVCCYQGLPLLLSRVSTAVIKGFRCDVKGIASLLLLV